MTRQFLRIRGHEIASLFSPKHYSADNLANKYNLASADDRASADDLEIQYHLASADNLEFRHNRTTDQSTKPTNPERFPPREAVKFNVPVHRAAANDVDFRIRAARGSGATDG